MKNTFPFSEKIPDFEPREGLFGKQTGEYAVRKRFHLESHQTTIINLTEQTIKIIPNEISKFLGIGLQNIKE